MGLLRGVARTAVVAGTATAVSGRVQRRQQARWDSQAQQQPAQQEQYAQPPQEYVQPQYETASAEAAAPAADPLERLKTLGDLKAQGVLTEAEFEAQKAKILAG
ncbi:SHOCT domain-containing protein [Arthrobacter sulfonylureivorans]|uniref:SHOCT domain-containing protein n=1 Tax=Arthrobacter sulfonylureivorans TaxID=2486855 RepID=A0ABY3W2P0_9MICC|nr:SHOCT domain-containing protein [Arthrobacter sulfonylureivorans]UNK44307.1 SHOCT domain-containing protein [Arthrobacter sulfonylureivorans]